MKDTIITLQKAPVTKEYIRSSIFNQHLKCAKHYQVQRFRIGKVWSPSEFPPEQIMAWHVITIQCKNNNDMDTWEVNLSVLVSSSVKWSQTSKL